MIIKGQEIGENRITPIGPLKIIDKHTNFYPKTGRVFIQYVLENLLQRIVAYMHTNVSEDFDNIVVVDGIEGVGKSAITYIIAELFQPGFDFERQLTYTSDQLEAKLRRGDDKHSVFWLDEAYELVGKRDWQKDDHKKFVKNLVKMRSRNWTLMMDIPRMEDCDAYIRDHCEQILHTFESIASHTNGVVTYYYCINPEVSETEHGFFYSRVGKAGFVAREPLDARELDPADLAHTTWYYTTIQRGRPTWIGP